MKKVFLLMAAAMLTISASAQQRTAVTANKAGDNWYVGINAGVATNMQKWGYEARGDKKAGFFKGFSPEFGLRIGKNLTTVFGLAADINAYFGNKNVEAGKINTKSTFGSKTFINATDFDVMTTWNLNNAFAGYKGEPRTFEVIALVGGGYSRNWAAKAGGINAKAAIDFAFNLGAEKAWQIYIEPGATLGEPAVTGSYGEHNPFRRIYGDDGKKKFNGVFSLKAGVNYKFGTSNGTHNFKVEQLRDQAEIDGLNAQINGLRAENDAKAGKLAAADKTIADLKAQLAACQARPATVVKEPVKENILQPIVIFRQGKSTIDAAQYASVEMVAKYMKNHADAKVKIQGYASPEGSKEFNQKLSEKRAEAVKTALIKKYKIAADRISVEGLGATDKLSQERDFNRVAMFIDTTK